MLTLKPLFQEVAKKRGRLLEKSGQQASDDYEEVWDAFNRYLTSVLETKKGVNVTNFCKIGWKIERARPGQKQGYRPYFQLSESFTRACGIEARRVAPVPDK